MGTRKKAFVMMLASCVGLAAWAAAAGGRKKGRECPQGATGGKVIYMQGRPKVKDADGKEQRPGLGESVCEGDVISTGSGDKISLILLGGQEFRVNTNSEFTLESGGTGNKAASLFTKLGQAWARRMLGGESNLNIRSGMAVASVRGTEADVDVTTSQMAVKVYEGHVDVKNDQGSQSLVAGQMTSVASGKAPAPPQSMSDKDKGTWQASMKPQMRSLKLRMPNGKEVELKFQSK